jgi:hypothetical protein
MSKRTGHFLAFLGVVVVLAWGATSAKGDLITFDDLPPLTPLASDPIPNGYHGFTWSNFQYINGLSYTNTGYYNGVVSPSNVAFDPGGSPAYLSSVNTFSVQSMDLTAAWNNNLQMDIYGFTNAGIDHATEILNVNGPTLVTLNWSNLTELYFSPSGGVNGGYADTGTHFVLDNLQVTSSATPEPATLTLLGAGFLAFGGFRFARRRRMTSTT